MTKRFNPVAGKDYPRTQQEFSKWFGDEESCRRYLVQCRWPDGFVCPRCGIKDEPWRTRRGYFHCRHCRRETSITAGTIFERTKMPLMTWFTAMWLLTSQKDGASALGMQRVLGFGSYQTAWTWLHKMRQVMVRPDRDRLSGRIEVDETYIGGRSKGGKRGRGSEKKEIAVIAVEVLSPKGFGRIRMRRIPDVSANSLAPFVCDVAKKGSEILTDGWKGYNTLTKCGYKHERSNLSDSGDPAHISMPGVHRIASLVKRWLLSTYQGSASPKHLEYYLDEYTFRFNRRTSRSRGLLFYRLLQQSVASRPISYRDIIDGKHNI